MDLYDSGTHAKKCVKWQLSVVARRFDQLKAMPASLKPEFQSLNIAGLAG